MSTFISLRNSFVKHNSRPAFCIDQVYYSYDELLKVINTIREKIREVVSGEDKIVGLIANDDIQTYASILALWFEGKAYVPITTITPPDRCKSIIEQSGINFILDSSETNFLPGYKTIETKKLTAQNTNTDCVAAHDSDIAYILFTSGTSGIPKGVPITRANVNAFVASFHHMNIHLTEQDRCLQMFELTFDVSVMSYLIPLLSGACVYTIPKDKIKYEYIFQLMDEKQLTCTLMVPTVIQYLRPYFNEIDCPSLRYSLFAGEALGEDVIREWSACVPNATIMNNYGPTENTIICTQYDYVRNGDNKSSHGFLPIGKPMWGNDIVIMNENNEILPAGEKGEMCLAGPQLTVGYWRNEEKNKTSFVNLMHEGELKRFYRTGDLCFFYDDGNIMYSGRIDFQAKIQGFRVELAEVEHHVKQFMKKTNVVAIAFKNSMANTELGLVIEAEPLNKEPLIGYLKTKIPAYMIPTQYRFCNPFPLGSSGKTDRNKLAQLFIK